MNIPEAFITSVNSLLFATMQKNRPFLLASLHKKFLKDLYDGSKIYESPYCIIPTVIFFISTFVVLFDHFHRYTRRQTSWKSFIFREFGLQSSFFYMTRFWFLILRGLKWLSNYADKYIEEVSEPIEVEFNKIFVRFCIMCFLTFLSFVPAIIFSIEFFIRDEMNNFFLWNENTRWRRTEMGAGGQLLLGPSAFTSMPSRLRTNISKRTASADANIWRNNENTVSINSMRNYKSMINLAP